MRAVRRSDHAPRVEMMPLIDVVFLLLTFFIYSMLVMVRAEVFPLRVGESPEPGAAARGSITVLAIDADGGLTLAGRPVTEAELPAALDALAADPAAPPLYVSMDEDARAAVFARVLQQAQAAGVQSLLYTYRPSEGGG